MSDQDFEVLIDMLIENWQKHRNLEKFAWEAGHIVTTYFQDAVGGTLDKYLHPERNESAD